MSQNAVYLKKYSTGLWDDLIHFLIICVVRSKKIITDNKILICSFIVLFMNLFEVLVSFICLLCMFCLETKFKTKWCVRHFRF